MHDTQSDPVDVERNVVAVVAPSDGAGWTPPEGMTLGEFAEQLSAKLGRLTFVQVSPQRHGREGYRLEARREASRGDRLRLRVLEDLKATVRAERLAARQSCTVRLGEARGIKDEIQRARAALLAERKYQADLRRIEAAHRQRRREAPGITRLERQGESDDEVRANVPPDLVALFERVKRSIKASPRMSRTEAFLKYAEEHPSEVLEAIDDKRTR